MGLIDKIFKVSNKYLRDYPFCHSKPSRSIKYNGRYFGLCARCTSMYLGAFISLITFPLWYGQISTMNAIFLGIILLMPGGVDGTTQMFGSRESTNRLRLITGFFLGGGIVILNKGIVLYLHNLILLSP